MASFDEEVQAELNKRKAEKQLAEGDSAKEATPVAPATPEVEPSPVSQPAEKPVAQAATQALPPVAEPAPAPAPENTDFDSLVEAELNKRKQSAQKAPADTNANQETKEPDYVTKFREYGPDKDDEDVKITLELLSPKERDDLLKVHPWAYNRFTPKQQDEVFEESRKSKPITGEDVASVAGSLLGTGVDLAKSVKDVVYDLVDVGVTAPINQAIKNKSFFEVKGENDILQAAKEKLDKDATNLSSAIPSSIIGATRMIQKMFGGKDLNGIANPIQRAIATLAPNDIQGYVGLPIADPNAGQINPWSLIPNTGYIPFDIVTKLAQAASDKDAGGIAAVDRLNEMLGIQDKDQSRNRDHIRRLYDAEIGAEDWKASNGQKKLSPWSQVAFSDIGQQAILFRERSLLPSIEFIAEHDGISLEQAQEKRNRIAEINAEKATTELTREWNRDYDPSMEFLGSLFLGDAAFGEAGLALGTGKLSAGLFQKAKTLGMTDREVSRYYDALQKLEKAKLIARQKDMSRPSWWGKTAEYVEKKQDEVSAAGQTLFENLPAPVQAAAPIAGKILAKAGLGGVGGGVGALLDPENPSVGMLQGLTLTTALGVTPSVVRSIDRARRAIGAGEGGLFTKVAKSEESSIPAKIIFNKATGPVIDYIAENSTALFKSGVNLGALSAVTATLNSDDPEEFNQAVADGFGMGMGFHLAHGITGRIHGKDPAQDLKNRRKRDVEIFEAVKTASPATQGMLEEITNYQTAIDRVDALVAKSEANLEQAAAKGDEKETKAATDALKNAKALQKEVLRANVQTRNEYGRSFLSTYADMNRLANGSRRAGQPNISLEILSPEQIADLYVSENSRQGMTPDEIAAVRAQGESYANERGYFDKAKNRAVINAQHVLNRTTLFGESPSDALRHEGSHALDQIPEFQKLNEKTDRLLFTTEEKDLQGNVLKRNDGIYDDKALVDMYFNKYIGNKNQEQKIKFSEQLGLYDPATNQFNVPEIVKYMKSEIRAELSAGSLRSGLGKLMGAEATIANWVGMRQKQNYLARAIQAVTGLGGKPFSSELLDIEFTPEVIAANREAIKALADFNGRFDLNPEGTSGREMSEKEIRTSPVLRKRYGLSGGEFQTELKGVVRDANGKIVGTPVRITNPSAAEGNWTFDEAGNRKQTRGYGQVPDEFQGVQVPAGGSLEVYRDFVYEPDGKTPVTTKPNDLANLETARGDAIRQALTDAVYDDSTTRLAPFSADGLSWSGIMSKSQVQAIKDIPESILPLSIKEKILAFNDTMARGDGSTFDFDYAPRLGRGKKYKGRKSDIYHVIPIGFGFSKAGNFYLRTLSLSAAFRKLKARAKLMDGWLTPWDNDPSLFMKELQEVYLNNTYEKRDGWLGLDPENPTEKTPLAEVKFGRFLDFMNMIGSDTPPNPQRATTPADPAARKRKTKAGADEEDNQGIDNLWRSFRLDAIADYVDTTQQTGRYRIDLDRVYKALMPAEDAVIEPQDERRPTPFDGITAAYNSQGRAFGVNYVPPAAPEAQNTGIQFMPASAEIREKGSKQQLEFFDRVLENSGIKDKPNTMAALDKFIHSYVVDKYYAEEGRPLDSLFPQVDPLKIRNYYQKVVRDATPEQAADFPPDWLRIRNMDQAQFDASFGQDRVDKITQLRVNALAKSANYLLGEMKSANQKEIDGLKKQIDDLLDEWNTEEDINRKEQINDEYHSLQEKRKLLQDQQDGGSYTPAEVAAILNASAKFRVNTRVNENGEMTPVIQNITNGNEAVPNEVSGETASKIAEYMRMGMSSKDAYVKGLYDNMVARAKKRGVYTGWKKYDQSTDMGDAETLNADCAGTGWCTGGSVGTANSHLSGGDFYLYFDKGEPQLAIRTEDGAIAEVRGTGKSQNITSPEYDAEAERFIQSGEGPQGGENYLHDRNFRKLAVEIIKTGVLPEGAYKYYDQNGKFYEPKPKQVDYGNGFEKEYIQPFINKAPKPEEAFNEKTGVIKTSYVYDWETSNLIKQVDGDIIGPSVIRLKDWSVDMPLLESVKGGIIVQQAGGLLLPNLKSCDYIYAREAVDVDISNLEKCNSISVPQATSLIAPKLKEVPRLLYADEAMDVDLRNLESAGQIKINSFASQKRTIRLDSLKTLGSTEIQIRNGDTLTLPKLETAKSLSLHVGKDGALDLPNLVTAERIFSGAKEVNVPKLTITTHLESYGREMREWETRIDFNNCQVLNAPPDVFMKLAGRGFIEGFTYTDSLTGKTYKTKSRPDFGDLAWTFQAIKDGDKQVVAVSGSPTPEEVLSVYEVETQGSRDRAQGIQFMPRVDIVPEKWTGTGEEPVTTNKEWQKTKVIPVGNRRGDYSTPPSFIKKHDISEFVEGGKMFDADTGEDITGRIYSGGSIDASGTSPSFATADNQVAELPDGRTYKTNLFKKSAGWEWISENPPTHAAIGGKDNKNPVLISVEGTFPDGGEGHRYTLKTNFEVPVELARYSNKSSEPRLRPTGKSNNVVFGNEVGMIRIGKKTHPVYDTITIGEKPASDISFMPAEGESKPVPTQEELDAMKARLPKYRPQVITSEKSPYAVKINIRDENGDVAAFATAEWQPNGEELNINRTTAMQGFKKQGYGEALYRELAKFAQSKGFTALYGEEVSPDAQKVRSKLFEEKPSYQVGTPNKKSMWKEESDTLRSKVPRDIRFMPARSQEELDKMKESLPEYIPVVKEEERDGDYTIDIKNSDGKVVGWAQLTHKGKNLIVDQTYVSESQRKQGYGQALYREIAKLAQSLDSDYLFSDSVSASALRRRNELFNTYDVEAGELGTGVRSVVPWNISFMPASKLDEAHAKAIESGDTEEAQRLVDEAARKAGWDTDAWYHGQNKSDKFNVFDPTKGQSFGGWNKFGSWFTKDEKQAKEFAKYIEFDDTGKITARKDGNIYKSYVDLVNPLYVDGFKGITSLWEDYTGKKTNEATDEDIEKFKSKLKELGYDSIVAENVKGDSLGDADESQTYAITLYPSQIKSADSATYDDQGNLIPLSQRFDTSKQDIRFMPYSPELPKTEDGKVDWAGFKAKTMEIAKPLADLSPLGGISFMPAKKPIKKDEPLPEFDSTIIKDVVSLEDFKWDRPANVEFKLEDGRKMSFSYDPKYLQVPEFKDLLEELKGESVILLEADRQRATGGDMGGPLHPFLLSNQITITGPDGIEYKAVWANMTSTFVSGAKNRLAAHGAKYALVHLMDAMAHKSNKRTARTLDKLMRESNLDQFQKEIVSLAMQGGIIAGKKAALSAGITALGRVLKESELSKEDIAKINKLIKEKTAQRDALTPVGIEAEIFKKITAIKTAQSNLNTGRWKQSSLDNAIENLKEFTKTKEYKALLKKNKSLYISDNIGSTFNDRGSAIGSILSLKFGKFEPSKIMRESSDFREGENLDIVTAVELSQNPEMFALYFGKDPKEEAAMSPAERKARDAMRANPKFVEHEAYDWVMLGPKNGNNFLVKNPVKPEQIFKNYRKIHPKQSVKEGSDESVAGAMRKYAGIKLIVGKNAVMMPTETKNKK
jgi:predicted GNAT family acetyltransferase